MSFIVNPNQTSTFNFNPKLKVGILASGAGTNFQALINSTKSYLKGIDISILIYNNKDCLAKGIASRNNIPSSYFNHKNFRNREDFDRAIVNKLKYFNVECIVMAGWMRLVTPYFINSFENRIINIHPSILPSFKGIDAITQSIKSGVKITGCTVHKVINEVDSGEIIAQAAVTIDDNDDINSLKSKIQEQEHKILPYALGLAATSWRNIN